MFLGIECVVLCTTLPFLQRFVFYIKATKRHTLPTEIPENLTAFIGPMISWVIFIPPEHTNHDLQHTFLSLLHQHDVFDLMSQDDLHSIQMV